MQLTQKSTYQDNIINGKLKYGIEASQNKTSFFESITKIYSLNIEITSRQYEM